MDIVSDGEFGKTGNWAWYIHRRISGFTERPATPEEAKDPLATRSMGQDFAAFPEFYAEYFPTQGLRVPSGIVTNVCNGPIRYIGQEQVQRDIANLKAAVAKVNVEDAFLPVVAPASAFPFYKTNITLTSSRSCSRWPKLFAKNTRRYWTLGCVSRSTMHFFPGPTNGSCRP